MSRSFFCFLVALPLIMTHPTKAVAGMFDWEEHRNHGEHVESCEKEKYSCLLDIGPAPRRSHEMTQCAIAYDQCMDRGILEQGAR